MTEPIKQEIINNIFENGDKLITGPILQTVLIDMIDDVNVKDQEILSKTGSWDNAVTQIPNLATKGEVTNLSESIARDLANVDVDLTGYATEQWVQNQGYLKEHQDISGLATKTELNDTKNNLQGNITSLSESVARDLANVSVPEGVATEAWVQSQDYASKSYVDNAVSSSSVDLTGYATETWVQNQGYLKEHQDISGLATKTELTSVSESVQTDITNLSESVANSAVWKKGTGTDSIVQAIADGTNLPTATGDRAIATGINTNASGRYSHAEGTYTTASGYWSHAEGYGTVASENASHAEGYQTKASGSYNHAEGDNTTALGSYSHAEGRSTKASGDHSHTEGNYTNASGSFSHAEGNYANALGQYSHAEGQSTNASGEASHAEGQGANASGDYSHAEGSRTTASGYLSHAEGSGSIASETGSHAEGFGTTAEGGYCHAEGCGTRARFGYSHAEGWDTTTSGLYSHAEGNYTKADGESSHAEGRETKALGIASHAEGWGTIASNEYEHAQGMYNLTSSNQIFSVGAGEYANGSLTRRNAVSVLAVKNSDNLKYTASVFVQNVGGYDGTNPEPGTNDLATVINGMSTGGGSSETLWEKGTGTDSVVQAIADGTDLPTATGERAVATGLRTVAGGNYSHAEGFLAEAPGLYSHAEGYGGFATGNGSHTEGYFAKASKVGSHAEGRFTNASGDYSHAEGTGSNASGEASHAEGGYTATSNQYEHAQGRYNYTSSNQIFSIGAGNSDTDRKNAVSVLEVDNSGSYTSSIFIQNIGGYDGTNPEPGTNDLATVINNLPSGGGSSETLWKKGTGEDSAVLILTGDREAKTPTATTWGAIATGYATTASGNYSHAEGWYTNASGQGSHAEGQSTNASNGYSHAEGNGCRAEGASSHAEGYYTTATANYSHTEGDYTVTSNNYEHAQGRYNHNSENQIFSIGTGNSNTDRRNVVSVLEVSNNNSYTGSVFIQNVGGYDGTNPTPGTNDLATVLNNTETWTFTLDDGSTVTKNVRIS